MIRRFKQTPIDIMKIIALFRENNLSYNLFKCEHIFEGKNKNVDILFETEYDYQKAAQLMEQEGFILYLSERFEKFKMMYVRFNDNFPLAIHLHREVAWHGLKALDKKLIFSRQISLASGIIVPSPEDSLLIHAGHILFENFSIKENERELISTILHQENLNWDCIKTQLQKNGWEKSFYVLLNVIKHGRFLENKDIFFHFGRRVFCQPQDFLTLTKKIIKKGTQRFDPRRKGTLIALIGVNGAGKTTLANKLIETYQPFTELIGKRTRKYYYGWVPFTPWAKGFAWIFRDKKTFRKVAEEYSPAKKINLFQETLFIYNYIEYLFRYWFQVYPKLRQGEVIVSDRYFYDLYGQYPSGEKSFVLKKLISLFPKPNCLFVLDTGINTIMERGKSERDDLLGGRKRKVKSREYLISQKKRYTHLSDRLNVLIIDTGQEISKTVTILVDSSWKKTVLP